MTDHVFISYSTADALEFARQLADELEGRGDEYFDAWLDKRDIDPARDWDNQLVEGIKTCKCMVFVMSKDSTAPGTMCKNEWTWALKYKKLVIPIRYHKVEQPFGLGNRQWIDFTGEFEHGMAQLRMFLRKMGSPEGVLQALKDRLSDAERDLRRAKGDEAKRIQVEIEELKAQIQVQQNIVDNPEAAKAQTQKNIETGLERERKPEKPTAAQTSTKFINPPPGIAPNYFQDRVIETEQIVHFLQDDSQRLMTIVGRGGVGKTAMVCRLLKGLEGGELPDELGKMRVDGIVYLSESGSHRVNFANLFYDLCKLLPSDAAQELDAVYKNPQGSTESKMRALLEKFGGGRVVALLDNFEPLVDTETFAIRDAELDEALRAFLNGTHSAVKVVITTRVAPRALNLIQPGRQRGLTLDEGLESPYAENILREMDSDGRLGLKSAGAEALNRARIKTRGFPRALEALFAILASDRYTTLEELLAMPLPENVVEALVGEAFNRLDTNAQKVMQVLAVYNRPVTPAAVDFLLAPHLPAMDSAPILQRLANMHFARKESGRFYLHPVDREFAYNLIPEGSSDDIAVEKGGLKLFKNLWDLLEKYPDLLQNQETFNQAVKNENANIVIGSVMAFQKLDASLVEKMQQEGIFQDENFLAELDKSFHIPPIWSRYALSNRAADYFAQARKPRTEWKKLEDLSAQLAEFDLRCAAGDYDTATSVLTEIDGEYLLLWGHYRLMIDMHEKLRRKVKDKFLDMLGVARLGLAYAEIGRFQEFAECQEQALNIARETGDRINEGSWLNNLGNVYSALGDVNKAIEYYEGALAIAHEIGDNKGEGSRLGNLGNRYADLGDAHKAIEYYEKALIIQRKIGDRKSESINLGNTGLAFLSLEDNQKAKEFFLLAIQIADEIHHLSIQNYGRDGLAKAFLFQNGFVNARATIEAALQYDVPENNHNASALHGIIALRQGDEVMARGAFLRTIGQADEILSKTAEYYSALDAKGLALCGLALCVRDSGPLTVDGHDGQPSTVYRQQAIEAFQKARKIAPHAGVVKSVLRLFDELAKCDHEGILKDVRSAAAGSE